MCTMSVTVNWPLRVLYSLCIILSFTLKNCFIVSYICIRQLLSMVEILQIWRQSLISQSRLFSYGFWIFNQTFGVFFLIVRHAIIKIIQLCISLFCSFILTNTLQNVYLHCLVYHCCYWYQSYWLWIWCCIVFIDFIIHNKAANCGHRIRIWYH